MNRALRIISIIFLIIGMVFLLVAAGAGVISHRSADGMVEVSGTIIQVRNHRPTVEYMLSGQTCTVHPSMNSTTFRVGDTYRLLADPADPTRTFDVTVTGFLMIIFGLMGGVFTLVAAIIFVILRRQLGRREELLAIGRRVTATVSEVRVQRNVTVNRRHPVYVLADCVHPYTGQSTQVKSHSVFRRDLTEGQTVDVYFDPNDPDKYIVELTEEAK